MTQSDPHENLRTRTKLYANSIIKLYTLLQRQYRFDDVAMVIAKQLLRSGTSVAANHREAKYSRSKADRIAKFYIVIQELEESALWLELLAENELADATILNPLLNETNQLIGIFLTVLRSFRHNERDFFTLLLIVGFALRFALCA